MRHLFVYTPTDTVIPDEAVAQWHAEAARQGFIPVSDPDVVTDADGILARIEGLVTHE